MKMDEPRGALFQIHLSTLVVQMFVLSISLYLQLTPREVLMTDYDRFEKVELRGWPEVFIITHTEWAGEDHYIMPKYRNVILTVVILALLFFLQEAWLRRPKPLFTWVRGAIAVLLMAAVGYGTVVFHKEYKMYEYVSVKVTHKTRRSDRGTFYLYSYGAYEHEDRRWVPVEWLPELNKDTQLDGYALVTGERIHNVWSLPVASGR